MKHFFIEFSNAVRKQRRSGNAVLVNVGESVHAMSFARVKLLAVLYHPGAGHARRRAYGSSAKFTFNWLATEMSTSGSDLVV
jgi:hypothetical protein